MIGIRNRRTGNALARADHLRQRAQAAVHRLQLQVADPAVAVCLAGGFAEPQQQHGRFEACAADALGHFGRQQPVQIGLGIVVAQLVAQRVGKGDLAVDHVPAAVGMQRRHQRQHLSRQRPGIDQQAAPVLARFPEPAVADAVAEAEKDRQRQPHQRERLQVQHFPGKQVGPPRRGQHAEHRNGEHDAQLRQDAAENRAVPDEQQLQRRLVRTDDHAITPPVCASRPASRADWPAWPCPRRGSPAAAGRACRRSGYRRR